MTQYQQVLAALKELGGEATAKAIYDKIKETAPEWKTKTPVASVAAYLSTGDDFKKGENGVWTLQDLLEQDVSDDDTAANSIDAPSSGRGLYFITLSPYIKIPGAGLLFKIGQSGDIKTRLRTYNATLPVVTVQVISFYPIPDNVDLRAAENAVNGELKGGSGIGQGVFEHEINIRPYPNGHQSEWLQTLDIRSDNIEGLNRLAKVIDSIVDTTIANLKKEAAKENSDE